MNSLFLILKKIIKKILPNFFLTYIINYIKENQRIKFSKMSQYEVFKEIYTDKAWSASKGGNKFYSGIGSHDPQLVNRYIEQVNLFFNTLKKKPNVVDLGCGDFAIGSKLRKYCDKYIAIDIFDELIAYNIEKYQYLNVDFRVGNITDEELPEGDVCFVRQVLQHLSNEAIANFILKIKKKYKYLIITEHLPSNKDFICNLDKPTGPDIRLSENSGVVLTAPPFNIKAINKKTLCDLQTDSVPNFEGTINTTLLELY
jgi:SAM-dependent methyltransferase